MSKKPMPSKVLYFGGESNRVKDVALAHGMAVIEDVCRFAVKDHLSFRVFDNRDEKSLHLRMYYDPPHFNSDYAIRFVYTYAMLRNIPIGPLYDKTAGRISGFILQAEAVNAQKGD